MNKKQLKFMLDTDIGPDVDDAAALLIANICQARNDAELLCVTHCTSSPYGVGAIRAINDWCGYPDMPVGTLKKSGFLCEEMYEKYNKALAMTVSEDRRDAEDAVRVMRKALAGQPDGEVTIIAIGPLVNIAGLLASAPDEISPLSGRELASRKVRALYLMAGSFDPDAPSPWNREHAPMGRAPEWNILMDIESAKEVIRNWPSEVVFGGAEIGNWVVTLKDTSILPESCPVRRAYDLYTEGAGRMSWDLLVVYRAMEENVNCVALSQAGTAVIDDAGCTDFTEDSKGKHYIMKLTVPAEAAAAELNNYLSKGALLFTD